MVDFFFSLIVFNVYFFQQVCTFFRFLDGLSNNLNCCPCPQIENPYYYLSISEAEIKAQHAKNLENCLLFTLFEVF